MNITVTNMGQSKILCPLNRDLKIPLLPGQYIKTHSDGHHLELLENLIEHKVIVEIDGKTITDHKKSRKSKKINRDLKMSRRIKALKSGMKVISSKLRKKINNLEFKLTTIVPNKDVSAFMNLLTEKTDDETKLSIFKRILKDNVKIREISRGI